METIISLKLSELTEQTLKRLKKILTDSSNNDDPEIKIFIGSDISDKIEYFKDLDKSIKQYETGEVTTFLMEEFLEYAKSGK